MKTVQYEYWAVLQKWPTITDGPLEADQLIHPAQIHEGTVVACIREFLKAPVSKRGLYELLTEAQPAFQRTVLSAADMLDIASRDDFPKN